MFFLDDEKAFSLAFPWKYVDGWRFLTFFSQQISLQWNYVGCVPWITSNHNLMYSIDSHIISKPYAIKCSTCSGKAIKKQFRMFRSDIDLFVLKQRSEENHAMHRRRFILRQKKTLKKEPLTNWFEFRMKRKESPKSFSWLL